MKKNFPILGARVSKISNLIVEVTERCNSRCQACQYWSIGKEDVDVKDVLAVVDRLQPLGLKNIMLTGGEPFLHPEFGLLLAELARKSFSVHVVTNGLFIAAAPDEVVEAVSTWTISLDAVERLQYREIRGIDGYDYVMRGILRLVTQGCKVRLTCLIQHRNACEVANVVQWSLDHGVTGINLMVPDFRGIFGPIGQQGKYKPGFLPTVEDILYLKQSSWPQIQEMTADYPHFLNFSRKDLELVITYLDSLARGQIPAVSRILPCSVPLTSMMLDARGSHSFCFYIPERLKGSFVNPNSLAVQRLRRKLTTVGTVFENTCGRCLQMPIRS